MATSAIDAARERGASAQAGFVETLLDIAIDGRGPVGSARDLADAALERCHGDADAAIDDIASRSTLGAAAGGFLTSAGGFLTLPVSLAVNVVEFYAQGTRMVAAIAALRGYDVDDSDIRAAVLLVMSGAQGADLLARFGTPGGPGGVILDVARNVLPAQALMLVNKALGFRLLRSIGEVTFGRLGRVVPVLGGALGAGVDAYLMRRIAASARDEFPEQ